MIDHAAKQSLIADICRFVQIPSRSSPDGGEEGPLQFLVAQQMRQLGARVRTFEADDISEFRNHPLCHGPNRKYKDRPTVIGEIGPQNAPALLILAHSDTVEVNDPDKWSFDPFCGEIHKGAICGLGSSDDKWGIATMLAVMRTLTQPKRQLDKRLIFASTIDEENGVGNGALLLTLAGVKAEAALYLDGYQMKVFIGNMGGSSLALRPRGQMDKGQLARHTQMLSSVCEQLSRERAALFTQPFFEDNATKDKSVVLRQKRDSKGLFFTISFFMLPGEDRQAFCKKLDRNIAAALAVNLSDYEISYGKPWFEPSLIAQDTPLIGYLADSIQHVLGQDAQISTISKQDSFILSNHAKIPTVSFGPCRLISGRGAPHQPDECLNIEQAWHGCQIVCETVGRWLGEDVQ